MENEAKISLEKCCTKCKEMKDSSSFSAQSKAKDGLQSICKSCYASIGRERRKRNPCYRCGEPKEVGVPQGARLCLECSKVCSTCEINPRDKRRSQCVECRNESNRKKVLTEEEKLKRKAGRIASLYKVSKEKAFELLEIKNCEICGSNFGGKNRLLHVDHCHTTDKVRGVLCFNCNGALGHINDDKERLLDMVVYLSNNDNGKQDILKAIHYLELILEMEYKDETK